MTYFRLPIRFFLAVLSTATVASIFSSQVVISHLNDIGVEVDFATRVSMTLADFGIFETLVPVSAVCLAIGFLVAEFCQRRFRGTALFWFALAGASALLSTLLLLRWQLDASPIAGARSFVGLSLQSLAGAIGGAVFVLSQKTLNDDD